MLEDNQVLVQGMMANRYMNTFRDLVLGWNKKLMAVADVVAILTEIQRTWAYLESLFVASEEVKKELPEATVRFAKIDADVKSVLAEFKKVQNCVACCGKDGLLKFLEQQQSELEVSLIPPGLPCCLGVVCSCVLESFIRCAHACSCSSR
jgi:dynein heavy chain